jgi:hypothetical protein
VAITVDMKIAAPQCRYLMEEDKPVWDIIHIYMEMS